MGTANFYLEQAKLLFLLAAADSDPVIKELLNRRGQEYLRMADAFETGSSAMPVSEPLAQPAVTQQQQQIQPKQDEKRDAG